MPASLIHVHSSFKTLETNEDRIYDRGIKMLPANRLSRSLNSSALISSMIISVKTMRIVADDLTFKSFACILSHAIQSHSLKPSDLF